MIVLVLCAAMPQAAVAGPDATGAESTTSTTGQGHVALYRAGLIDRACDALSREKAGSNQIGSAMARLLNEAVIIETACGRLAEAAADGRAALAIAGLSEADKLIVEGNLALATLRSGKADQAVSVLQRVSDRQDGLGLAKAAALTRANLAIALWQADRLDEAATVLDGAIAALPDASAARLAALANQTAIATMTLRYGQAFDAAAQAAAIDAGGDRPLALRIALTRARAGYLGTNWQDVENANPAMRKAASAIIEAQPADGAHGVFDYIPLVADGAAPAQGLALLAGPEVKGFIEQVRLQATYAEPAQGIRAFDLIRPLEEQLGATNLLGHDLEAAARHREALGESAVAIALARRSGDLSLAQFDVDTIVNRDALTALADRLEKAGQAKDATMLRDRIARAPAILARARAIEDRYYADRRGPADNLVLVEQALRILEGYPGPNTHFYASQLDMKAVFLLEAGRPDEGIPVLQRAIEINRATLGAHSDDVVRQLVFLADLLRLSGRSDEARAQLAKLVRIAGETDANTQDTFDSYIAALGESGHGREGVEWATRRIEVIERVRLLAASQAQHSREMYANGQVGNIPTLAPDMKPVLLERARILLSLGKPDDAARDARAVLATIATYKDPMTASWDYPNAHILLGQALLATGKGAQARVEADAATAILARMRGIDPLVTNAAAVLQTRARLADAPVAATALDALRPLTTAALANPVSESLPLPGRLAAATGAISRVDLFALELDARWAAKGAEHDPQAAFAAVQRALATSASQAVALAAGRRLAAAGKPALGELAREREDLVGRFLAADRRYAEAASGTDAAAGLARSDADAAKQAILARFAAIDVALRNDAPGYFALVRQDPLALAQAQATLDEDEAVLIVEPGEFGTHLFALTRTALTWQRSDWNRNQIAQATRRLLWFASANVTASDVEIATWTGEVGGGENGFDRKTAYTLWQQVIAPVAATLAGHKRLFVIGGGALSSLPFAMLVAAPPEGADDDPAALRATHWFGDDHALTQLPSLQSLALLRNRPEGSATGGNRSFVGFGDPVLDPPAAVLVPMADRGDGGRRRGGLRSGPGLAAGVVGFRAGETVPLADPVELRGLKRIPGTAIELNAMAKVLGVSADRLFLGANDRETTFRASPLLRDAGIISLATHGLLGGSLSTVAEPGLVFTPPATPGAADDGYLTSSEVAALSLRADWVILSACNTAAGDGTAGAPGLSGLARAFFHAGARNLLVSNWPVRDDVAPSLTVGAIERVLQNPALNRAEALQQAVKAVRDNGVADKVMQQGISQTWAHPSAWAPFSLVGDGR
ncbi:CHAT domain-containing tetratricopeptide repeat protein [Novosphingobium sp.]|uniref:CHAT domain-containing tetratricopeptide repeat protein n=1 Tax=Novosphingobium sp. TaxID=1874826 RepID=UPI0025CBD778|nr:CHAT domain-containing tetratricopeptide repeat protein [Novosphingobium sp.]